MGNPPEDQDILEFIDTTAYPFLGSVSLTIDTFKRAFKENPNVTLEQIVLDKHLSEFAYNHFSLYFGHIQDR